MRLEFDPDVLDRLVQETLAWREAEEQRPELWDTYAHLLTLVEETYPGRIQWPTKWFFDRSAGFLQAIAIVYVSFDEYMAITGTPVATDGGSGPFPGEIFDWVIEGEINSFEHGEFGREPTKVGQLDYLPSGQMKAAAIDDHYWAFEYGRGPIPLMWPTTIVGTVQDMDFKNLFDMMATATKELGRNLLEPDGPPRETPTTWHNWAGNQSAEPAQYHRPATRSALVEIVRAANAENERRAAAQRAPVNIRCVGGGYSWSDLVPTDQWMVDMTRLNRVLAVDRINHRMTVEAGMQIGDLTALTDRYRMVLSSPTVITLVTVGGMIGTGAHGGGMHAGSFPDWVTEFTFVRADGEVVTIRKDDPEHAEDIRAAQVALGSLGALYSVTIQCEPTYNVESVDHHLPVDAAIERIPDLVDTCDFVEYFWFPLTDKMWVKETVRSNRQPDIGYLKRRCWNVWDWFREKGFGPPALWFVSTKAPRLTPAMMKLALLMTRPRRAIESANYALHYEDYYPKCFDMSVAIPLDAAQDAWRYIIAEIEREATEHNYPVNLIAHSRFLNGSDSYLSPTRDRDTCYIEILCVAETPGYEPFFVEMERQLCQRFDGRPHWGKLYYDPRALKAAYGGDMDRFLEVRERWDPDRLFLNPFLAEEVFQLPPR